MNISNLIFSLNNVRENDLFICAISHERRSLYMLEKMMNVINPQNIIVFYFELIAKKYSEEIKKLQEEDVTVIYSEYNNWRESLDLIVQKYCGVNEDVNIHVDYSSMPRGWYCRIPGVLEPFLKGTDKLCLWYVEAEKYNNIPYAGIRSFDWFSGQPTIRPENKRVHIIALGYDSIRTQAVLTMLDPDSYVTCEASDCRNPEIRNVVLEKNHSIISHSLILLSLDIGDFKLMLSKICDVARDFRMDGDVILVPDGPKPLIMAMSLVPMVLDKKGVTCLHISRNSSFENLTDEHNVYPSDRIVGFSIQNSF